jgi:hypothetical protein
MLRVRRGASLCALVLATLAACLGSPAQASDRPYLLTSSAAAEEDDDGVWSIESWWQRAGSQRGLSLAAEYAFDPTTSVQLELARARDQASGDSANALELEVKHLFNRIGRDGWGWGVNVSLGALSAKGSGWQSQSLVVKFPWTLRLRDGDALLHVNLGLQEQRDERREWLASAAFEHKLGNRTSAFVELGREDRQTLLHGGVRHWLKRDKLAVDFSVQQVRSGGTRSHGAVIGIGWYDL